MHGRGPSNINLVIFVCSFDVCQVSEPVPYINYDKIHVNKRSGKQQASYKLKENEKLYVTGFFYLKLETSCGVINIKEALQPDLNRQLYHVNLKPYLPNLYTLSHLCPQLAPCFLLGARSS